uniref:Uncharacterized protein n=1 Tax=Arundo donax TaxID=35708 RepID=A0A0A9FRL5_ARUDO
MISSEMWIIVGLRDLGEG